MKKENKGNGFALRLTQAILYLLGAILCFVFAVIVSGILWGDVTFDDVMMSMLILGIPGLAGVILAVLQFIFAFRGKTSIRANNCSIAINSLFSLGLIGLFGLIGGIKGRKYLKPQKQFEVFAEPSAEVNENYTAVESGTEELSAELEELIIKPKMSPLGRKIIMIVMFVSYSLLFLAGILLVAVPALANAISGIGICEENGARAYAITIGVMWLALTPTIGYYMATLAPFDFEFKTQIIISAITTVLLLALNAVFFIIINLVEVNGVAIKEFYETSDTWFIPLSMVFASIAVIICYALTVFKLKPEKIKNEKPRKNLNEPFGFLKYPFALIGFYLLKFVKLILTFKEKLPEIFIIVSTLLLTWLVFFTAFIFAIVCMGIFLVAIILLFTGFLDWTYVPSNSNKKRILINDGGTTRILTLSPNFVEERGEEVYEDETGSRWYSTDGGKTVYKK